MQVKKTALILSVGAVLTGGALAGWSASAETNPVPAAIANTAKPHSIALMTAPNYRAIVATNRAAVVGITTEERPTTVADQGQGDDNDNGDNNGDSNNDNGNSNGGQQGNGSPFGDNPFFRFFGQMPGQGQQEQPDNTPVRALGSGFIVRSDGIILTNAHVIHNARHVTVTLANHREYTAKVLGEDTATDVAVLKINAHDLPVVSMAQHDGLQVGDYVLAIGAPYGLEETATAGIVSAKGRSLPDDQAVPFIQTDVAVNPGNSGGPLFDSNGNVVGINSQIYSNTGGFEGVSFAIPISVAERVEDQILKTGKVEHARLGVHIQSVDQSLAKSFNLDTPVGALVSKVDPNSAAARAGIEAGDVILKYNGQDVADPGALSAEVSMAQPGQSATFQIWRNGRTMSVTAKLGAIPGKATQVSFTGENGQGKLGLQVRPLTADESNQAGVGSGLVVERVAGPAARAGIERGDVVLAVDGTPVTSASQLRTIVDKHGSNVALLIQRGDSRIFVPVQMS